VKAFSCDIRPGRRPRGPKLPQFVAGQREHAYAERRQAPRVEPEEGKSS
jgi:hypothetical protein